MTCMIETHIRQDETVACKPSGDLDWRTSVSFRHAVHDALRPGAHVLIDLSQVSLIDAVGLSAIVGTLRRARAVGALLRVQQHAAAGAPAHGAGRLWGAGRVPGRRPRDDAA